MRFLFGLSLVFAIWGIFTIAYAETTGHMINGTLMFLSGAVCYGTATITQAIERLIEACEKNRKTSEKTNEGQKTP